MPLEYNPKRNHIFFTIKLWKPWLLTAPHGFYANRIQHHCSSWPLEVQESNVATAYWYWQLTNTSVLFIVSIYLNTNQWPDNNKAQSTSVEQHQTAWTMMMNKHLAQRGQAGGSNIRIPEQSSNPKHSLQKCTWSERLTVKFQMAILSDVTGQANAQTDNMHKQAMRIHVSSSGTYQAAIPQLCISCEDAVSSSGYTPDNWDKGSDNECQRDQDDGKRGCLRLLNDVPACGSLYSNCCHKT